MKKYFLILIAALLTFSACDSSYSAMNNNVNSLEGNWQLNYITGPKISFEGLYPNNKPTISFNLKEKKISGNSSCNQYFGILKVDGNKIDFKDAKIGMTLMACQGIGEETFMKTLEQVDSYSISNDGKTLNFLTGDIAIMRFAKK